MGIALESAAATVAFAAPPLPAPLQALEKQGFSIVGTFPSPGGVTAYAARWIADGRESAPRTVFTDPNCPYCNKLWADARPCVDAGKRQLRHVMVGILTPTSAGKAAALLGAKDPAAAMDTHARADVVFGPR